MDQEFGYSTAETVTVFGPLIQKNKRRPFTESSSVAVMFPLKNIFFVFLTVYIF
jgi:hypothetical protein